MDVDVDGRTIRFMRSDITRQDTDAIVNAANSSLSGGGGVDGAIHAAAGPVLSEECARIRDESGGCKPGEAVITPGGNLKAGYVIHTVGPIWRGGANRESDILRNCYINCLRIADEHNIKSVSFPSISTGAYGYPIEEAAKIAIGTVLEFLPETDVREVRFILYSNMDTGVYLETYGRLSRAEEQ